MALLLVSGLVFHELAEAVMGQDAITVLDVQVAHWFNAHAVEPLTSLMYAISAVHSVAGMIVLFCGLAWYLWRAQARYWLLALAFAVPGGMVLNVALKFFFQRARPVFEEPLVTLATYSFPSGHTTAATCFYGLLASYLVIARPAWSVRLGTVAGCLMMVLLVAFSRVYLGAHYVSDVLAAMAESVAWLAVCITAISTLRRRREGKTV
ncbi:phosphatase PAP2 family protein [Pseudoduganella sp. FT25W]|uniref:Phosphatase PAP2 family protein n=1 Tax=Duganella alba TaxID=2666081 RepID=A0A6L5QH38_9BURK|nr:phosphatase PAP2 family protein [Duganella alba]MRX08960.1 phosphatase PAP2 family protein [Duganella alba]MRX18994.1 phosphatase PAP2 family protein [Duganella alba]